MVAFVIQHNNIPVVYKRVQLYDSMATLSGVRINLFNENFLSESEQDANTALMELDKGLRSTKLGIQCEAVVRFPRLFEKYPFPILINSSFLKLAEFFWNGSNLLRFWVLKVCQQSENHLEKILNIDEFVKRIFMVSHSNDPIARALTLRTLGAVSRVIPEKQQVHHAIRRALDSHDTIEVQAAIYASGQFTSQSRSFAISMCTKISDMIECLKIPVDMKLDLIPVLSNMHHDANTADIVKKLCTELLPKYPAEPFTIAILNSLTKLSSRTLIGVPDQVYLLFHCLQDARKCIRLQTLHSLLSLSKGEHLHAWPKAIIAKLMTKANKCSDTIELNLYLMILRNLSGCPLTCYILIKDQCNALFNLCASCIDVDDYTTCSQALEILTALLVHDDWASSDRWTDMVKLVHLNIESLLFATIREHHHCRILKKILSCGIKLSSVDIKFGIIFVEMLAELLNDNIVIPDASVIQLCQSLAAVSTIFQLRKFSPTLKHSINDLVSMKVNNLNGYVEENTFDTFLIYEMNPIARRLPIILRKLNGLLFHRCPMEINRHQHKSMYRHHWHRHHHHRYHCEHGVDHRTAKTTTTTTTNNNSNSNSNNNIHKMRITEILFAVVFQTIIGCYPPRALVQCYQRAYNNTNYWTQYRIARSASRYGQHFLAASVFNKLAQRTAMDELYFFFTSLSQMSQAECILNYGLTYDQLMVNYMQNNIGIKLKSNRNNNKNKNKNKNTTSTSKNTNTNASNINNIDNRRNCCPRRKCKYQQLHQHYQRKHTRHCRHYRRNRLNHLIHINHHLCGRHAVKCCCYYCSSCMKCKRIPIKYCHFKHSLRHHFHKMRDHAQSHQNPNQHHHHRHHCNKRYCCDNNDHIDDVNCDNNIDGNTDNAMPTIKRLETAINLYWQSLANMRACSSPTNPFTFQLEYLKLRAQFLDTLHSAMIVKNAQIIVPPPAIAGSLAQNSRDYLQKFGHITNQLRKLVKALKACRESYSKLYKAAFDADPATLQFLKIMEYQCAMLTYIVETICYATPSESPKFIMMRNDYPETNYFLLICRKLEFLHKELPKEGTNAKTINSRHLDIIIRAVELITHLPICMPRFFYQVLQSTQIKLSVNPQPRSIGEPVIVQSGSNLVIKVEGVIQHFSKKRSKFRCVDAVQLSLSSQLQTLRSIVSNNEALKAAMINETILLIQTVKPQRDFLSASFLLPISNGGQWQVTLEAYAIDENGITWYTGPKSSMVVRVLDDSTKTAQVAVSGGSSTKRF